MHPHKLLRHCLLTPPRQPQQRISHHPDAPRLAPVPTPRPWRCLHAVQQSHASCLLRALKWTQSGDPGRSSWWSGCALTLLPAGADDSDGSSSMEMLVAGGAPSSRQQPAALSSSGADRWCLETAWAMWQYQPPVEGIVKSAELVCAYLSQPRFISFCTLLWCILAALCTCACLIYIFLTHLCLLTWTQLVSTYVCVHVCVCACSVSRGVGTTCDSQQRLPAVRADRDDTPLNHSC